MKTLIYGNGPIARLLFSYARSSHELVGFCVDDHCIQNKDREFCGLPLFPLSQVENHFNPADHQVLVAVGFIEMNALREQKSLVLKDKGYALASYIHESVIIHDDVTIEAGCMILDHVSIHPGSRIGAGTFISSNVNVGHDCQLGPYNWLNSGVAIAGGCKVGGHSFFGVNASTGNDIDIGARNFIGANTFVGKNSEDDAVFLSEQGQRFPMNSQAFLRFSGITG